MLCRQSLHLELCIDTLGLTGLSLSLLLLLCCCGLHYLQAQQVPLSDFTALQSKVEAATAATAAAGKGLAAIKVSGSDRTGSCSSSNSSSDL
jgi:hypothetical protein